MQLYIHYILFNGSLKTKATTKLEILILKEDAETLPEKDEITTTTGRSRSAEDYLELKIIHTPSSLIFYRKLAAEESEGKQKQSHNLLTLFLSTKK